VAPARPVRIVRIRQSTGISVLVLENRVSLFYFAIGRRLLEGRVFQDAWESGGG
jgi:hypothetical protein